MLLFDNSTGPEKTQRLQAFLAAHPDIRDNGRAHMLPTFGLEDYYPAALRQQHANTRQKVKLPAKNIAGIVLRILNRGEADDLPEEIQKILLLPILNQLLSEMQDICSHDCIRVSTLDRRALTDEKDEVRTYWLRLEPSGRAEEADTRFLRLEKIDAPCAVGFAVGKDHGCPLFAFEPSIGNVVDFMGMIKRVAAFRKEQAALRRDEDEKKRARLAAKGDDTT